MNSKKRIGRSLMSDIIIFILGFVACLFVIFVFSLLAINDDVTKDDGKS